MDPSVADFAPREIISKLGLPITVRPVRATDEQAFHEAFLRLSAESRYSRFMSVVRDLTDATLHRATHPDAAREFALVAVVAGDEGERIVGGGRHIAVPGTTHCEFAVTVVDAWQGHGLGCALLSALKDSAAAHGHDRMEGYVLSTNGAMRRLGARMGFDDGPMPGDATVRLLTAVLREDTAGAAGA